MVVSRRTDGMCTGHFMEVGEEQSCAASEKYVEVLYFLKVRLFNADRLNVKWTADIYVVGDLNMPQSARVDNFSPCVEVTMM